MVTLKVIVWAVIFVITNGAVFADYFKNNKILSALSGLFALLSSVYLFDAMSKDMEDMSGYTFLLYILMAIVIVLTIWHILKEQGNKSEVMASASPKAQTKTEIQRKVKPKNISTKISHTIQKEKTKIVIGTFESDNDYKKRLAHTLFLVGQVKMMSYDANSHIMELELNFDKDIESIIKDIYPKVFIKLDNSDAEMLFGEQDKRELYISIEAQKGSLYIDSVFLVSKDREYHTDIDIVRIDNLMVEDTPITQRYTYPEAEKYARSLRLGGYNDWRLPTKDELLEIYKEKSQLKNIKDDFFWTSTTKDTQAWVVLFGSGNDSWDNKTNNIFVRCVR